MHTGIRIGIIEDEIIIAENIKQVIDDLGHEVLLVCHDYKEAFVGIKSISLDLIILDINLGGTKDQDGIALAYSITDIPFIFLTAFSDKETVARAVKCQPAAYLVKPVGEGASFAAIQNAMENFVTKTAAALPGSKTTELDHFYTKIGNKIIQVKWADVYCISSTKNYVQMMTPENRSGFLIRSSLHQAFLKIVPQHEKNNFIQINRSTYINKKAIVGVNRNRLITPYADFEIGPTYTNSLKKVIDLLK